eukprot:TRINITY_DN1682_c0_g1_i2.p1 TRINITY_DN1682_c0_g1~~TRINITY_DN1682_c0_g1_i2.p1  ORF type:complete len:2287 (+),score=630.36 TRINITY_DN1682_c0_g1_i2:63-6923(+)
MLPYTPVLPAGSQDGSRFGRASWLSHYQQTPRPHRRAPRTPRKERLVGSSGVSLPLLLPDTEQTMARRRPATQPVPGPRTSHEDHTSPPRVCPPPLPRRGLSTPAGTCGQWRQTSPRRARRPTSPPRRPAPPGRVQQHPANAVGADQATHAKALAGLAAVAATTADGSLRRRARELAHGWSWEGGVLDLRDASLLHSDLAVLGDLLRRAPPGTHLDLRQEDCYLDRTAGELLLQAVAESPTVVGVLCDGLRFEDPYVAGRIAAAAARHKAVQSRRHSRWLRRQQHSQRREEVLCRRWRDEANAHFAFERRVLLASEDASRLRTEEREGRRRVELEWDEAPLELLSAEGQRRAAQLEELRLCNERPRAALAAREAPARAKLAAMEHLARQKVGDLRLAAHRELTEQVRALQKELRHQRFGVSNEHRQIRHALQREEGAAWRAITEAAAPERSAASERWQVRMVREAKLREEENAREAAEQAARELAARKKAEEERARRRQRDIFSMDERKFRSQYTFQEKRDWDALARQYAAEVVEARQQERLGNRRRERERVNKVPPKMHASGFDPQRKVFWDVDNSGRCQRLWPQAEVRITAPLPMYLKRDESDVLPGEETAREWAARKGTPLSGTVTFTMSTSGAEACGPSDCLVLCDPLQMPNIGVDTSDPDHPVFTLDGCPVARVTSAVPSAVCKKAPKRKPSGSRKRGAEAEAEEGSSPVDDTPELPRESSEGSPMSLAGSSVHGAEIDERATAALQDTPTAHSPPPGDPGATRLAPPGVYWSAITFSVMRGATAAQLSALIRSIAFRRPASPADPVPPSVSSVRVIVRVVLTFPASSPVDDSVVCTQKLGKGITVVAVAPYLTFIGSQRLEWVEGDGDTPILTSLSISPTAPVDFKGAERCMLQDCLFTLRFVAGCRARDALLMQRRQGTGKLPRNAGKAVKARGRRGTATQLGLAPPSPDDEFIVNISTRTVGCQDREMARIEGRGAFNNTETNVPQDWTSTEENTKVALRLGAGMTAQELQRLLSHIVYRNDSVDPGDDVRVLEASLTDPDGERDSVRIVIDVKPEDNPTLITIGSDAVIFRPLVGDLAEALASAKPPQVTAPIALSATVQDVDTTFFTSGSLTALFTRSVCDRDRILVEPQEKSHTSLRGKEVWHDGAHIGTAEDLYVPRVGTGVTVAFTRNASIAAVESLIRCLCFTTEPTPEGGTPRTGRRRSGGPRSKITQKTGAPGSGVIPGTIKEGIRQITLSLVVEKAEPVKATAFVKATNALVTVPTSMQSLSFVEDSEPLRLSSRFDLLQEVQIFDGGALYAEFVEGFEDKDVLDLRLPDSSDLSLGHPKEELGLLDRMPPQGTAAGSGTVSPTPPRRIPKSGLQGKAGELSSKMRAAAHRAAAKSDGLGEMLHAIRDRVHNIRRATLRDIYIEKTTPQTGSKVHVLGTCFQDDQQVIIHFKEPSASDRRGGVSAPSVRRKDVQTLLRGLFYQHRGDNPKDLRKVIRVTLRDTSGPNSRPSCTFHHIQVQPVNDATQVHRLTQRPIVYRQHSPEDAEGFQPFADCTAHDPDSESFAGGYFIVEHLAGTPGGRGCDHLSLLTPEQQRAKGFSRVIEQTTGYGTRQELRIDGQLIGSVGEAGREHSAAAISTLCMRFNPEFNVTLNHVEACLHCVRYHNSGKRVKSGSVVLMLRVGAKDSPDGRLKIQIKVQGPPIYLPPNNQWAVYVEKRGSVPICPKIMCNVGEKVRCSDHVLSVRLLNPEPHDELCFNFRDSPLALKRDRKGVLTEDVNILGEVAPQSDAHNMVLDFSTTGSKCTGKHLLNLLRCIAFDCRGPCESMEPRRVEFRLSLPEATPFVLEAVVQTKQEDEATEVELEERTLTCCVGSQPLTLFPNAQVHDPDTMRFQHPAHFVVEATGALVDGEQLGIALPDDPPPVPKPSPRGSIMRAAPGDRRRSKAPESPHPPRSGARSSVAGAVPLSPSSLSPTSSPSPDWGQNLPQPLWLSIPARNALEDRADIKLRKTVVASVTGRGTPRMVVNLVDATLAQVQQIVQCCTYSFSLSAKKGAPGPLSPPVSPTAAGAWLPAAAVKRSASIAIFTGQSGERPPEKAVVGIELYPPVLEAAVQAGKIEVTTDKVLVIPKAKANLLEFAEVTVRAEFFKPTAGDRTAGPPHAISGWRVAVDERSGMHMMKSKCGEKQQQQTGEVTLERPKDRMREKVADYIAYPYGISVIFCSDQNALVTPKLVERFLRAIELRIDRDTMPPPSPFAHVRISITERLINHTAATGPRDGSVVASFQLA